jgi:hypothetical protein
METPFRTNWDLKHDFEHKHGCFGQETERSAPGLMLGLKAVGGPHPGIPANRRFLSMAPG